MGSIVPRRYGMYAHAWLLEDTDVIVSMFSTIPGGVRNYGSRVLC